MRFRIKKIPDEDSVFFRAHEAHFRKGAWQPSCFRDQGEAMSVDWALYSTASESHARSREPIKNAIFGLNVGNVRKIIHDKINFKVTHEPINAQPKAMPPIIANRAHSGVHGAKNTETRVQLSRIYEVVIPLGTESSPLLLEKNWWRKLIDYLKSKIALIWKFF